jgi:hypothetical protein
MKSKVRYEIQYNRDFSTVKIAFAMLDIALLVYIGRAILSKQEAAGTFVDS